MQPVYLELAGDRNEALQREAAIKRLSTIKKRELLSSPLNIVDRFDLL